MSRKLEEEKFLRREIFKLVVALLLHCMEHTNMLYWCMLTILDNKTYAMVYVLLSMR